MRDLTHLLISLRKLIKEGQISENHIRACPELITTLVEVSGASQNVENSQQSLSTIWCIVSRFPVLIDDFIQNDCISACLSKISPEFDKTIIPALHILYYLLDAQRSHFEFIYENAPPELLDEIQDKMTAQYSVERSLEKGHKNLLNAIALLMIPYSNYIEHFDENRKAEIEARNQRGEEEDIESFFLSDEQVNQVIRLLNHIMSLTSDIGLGYCFKCFYNLINHNIIPYTDFIEAELDVYFVTAMEKKNEEICRNACHLMSLLFDKGWKGMRFPALETMNFIKTCSDPSIDFIARETLASACVHASPDKKEEILRIPDFLDIIIHAISYFDEDKQQIGYGNFRIMEVAGKALLGIFHNPELPEFLTYYCQDIMLSLLSLLRINDDDLVIKSLQTIIVFIDYKAITDQLNEVREDFENFNGLDILNEYIEDDNEEICHLVHQILQSLEIETGEDQ